MKRPLLCFALMIATTAAMLLAPLSVSAQDQPGRQSAERPGGEASPEARAARQRPMEFTPENTEEGKIALKYLLYTPEGYSAEGEKTFPLLVFLHGAGERGDNLDRVKVHGPPKLVEAGKDFPFIVVSPQCPTGQRWNAANVTPLLEDLITKMKVDKDRVYLTGLSLGGYGTWSTAQAHPEMFAAIVPICGGGTPDQAAKMKDLPIWVFHGGRDNTVPIARSQQMVDGLKAAGAEKVKFTIYPEAGHDSWSEAYNTPELYTWLLEQKRPSEAAPVTAAQPEHAHEQ